MNSIDQLKIFKGSLTLVKAIALYYSRHSDGRTIDPLTDVLISVGGYGALFNACLGLLEYDDEVVIIEPFFDCYAPMSILAGAKCVYVPLKPQRNKTSIHENSIHSSSEWSWDDAELEAAFTSKTKLIIINTLV
jgi:kynurenine--oxoglutarate transaminase/cysteine-S-conjugate beta-lyase/glutamine--phenylpyruvate transaminase